MRLLWTYIIQAARSMRHRKQQTILSLVGLTVGLVCFTFSVNWLWYDTHYESFRPDYRGLCAVYGEDDHGKNFYVPLPVTDWLHDSVPGVRQASALYQMWPGTAAVGEKEVDIERLQAVHPEFLELMGIRLLHGNATTALQRRDAIVLPRSKAVEIFGREDALGQTILMSVEGNEAQSFYVSGVMEDQPEHHSWVRNDPLVSVDVLPDSRRRDANSNCTNLFFRADNPEWVRRAMDTKTIRQATHYLKFMPMRQGYHMNWTHSYWDAFSRPIQFTGLSLLLLISSLFNYIALLTSYWMGRRREYNLRLSLGGTWRSNMGWLYAEVGLMLAMTTILTLPGLEFITLFSEMPNECSTLLTTFGCVLPAFLAVALLAALYPLWYIHRISRRASLHDGRPLLLAVQIAIGAVMLFVFAGMFSQYRYMVSGNMGFRTDRVLRLHTRNFQPATIEAILAQLEARGGGCIEEAVMTSSSIFQSGDYGGTFVTHDTLDTEGTRVNLIEISVPALRFFGIEPTEGKLFSQAERGGVRQVMANRYLAEEFPAGTVVPGARLHDAWGPEYEVCGIINLTPNALNQDRTFSTLYAFTDDRLGGYRHEVMFLRHLPGKADEAMALVRNILTELQIPEQQILMEPLDEFVTSFYEGEQKQLRLFSLIAVAAVFVLVFGVYSFVAFVLRSHRKSIAVRRVFGATKGNLYKKYLRTYVSLTVVACAVAFPMARYLCGLWLQNFRSSVQIGWPHFLLIVLSLSAGVALLVVFCLRRTLSENPADVVKEE